MAIEPLPTKNTPPAVQPDSIPFATVLSELAKVAPRSPAVQTPATSTTPAINTLAPIPSFADWSKPVQQAQTDYFNSLQEQEKNNISQAADVLSRKLSGQNVGVGSGIGQQNVSDFLKANADRMLPVIKELAAKGTLDLFPQYLAAMGTEGYSPFGTSLNKIEADRLQTLEPIKSSLEAQGNTIKENAKLATDVERYNTMAPLELEAEINKTNAMSKADREATIKRLKEVAPAERQVEIDSYIAKSDAQRESAAKDHAQQISFAIEDASSKSTADMVAEAASMNISLAEYKKNFVDPITDALKEDYNIHPDRYAGTESDRDLIIGAMVDSILAGNPLDANSINMALKLKGEQPLAQGELETILGSGAQTKDLTNVSWETVFPKVKGNLRFDLRENYGFEAIGKNIKYSPANVNKFKKLYAEDPMFRTKINDAGLV